MSNDDLKKFLKEKEGNSSEMYRDPAGIPTTGYGSNLNSPEVPAILEDMGVSHSDVLSGEQSLTPEQQQLLLDRQMWEKRQRFNKIKNASFPSANLSPNQENALMSMFYNRPGLIGPDMRKALEAGDSEAVFQEIVNKSNKNKDPGIQKRRMEEAEMFSGEDYPDFINNLTPEQRDNLYNILGNIKNPNERAAVLEKYQALGQYKPKFTRFNQIDRILKGK